MEDPPGGRLQLTDITLAVLMLSRHVWRFYLAGQERRVPGAVFCPTLRAVFFSILVPPMNLDEIMHNNWKS
jgi:hypothetical protein